MRADGGETQDDRGPLKQTPHEPCENCGGNCLAEDEDELTPQDCQWFGNRLNRMNAARPRGAKEPHQLLPGRDGWDLEDTQMVAFEEGLDEWWLIMSEEELDARLEARDGEAEEEGESEEEVAEEPV